MNDEDIHSIIVMSGIAILVFSIFSYFIRFNIKHYRKQSKTSYSYQLFYEDIAIAKEKELDLVLTFDVISGVVFFTSLFVKFNKEFSMDLLHSSLVDFLIKAGLCSVTTIFVAGCFGGAVKILRVAGKNWFVLQSEYRKNEIECIEARGIAAANEAKTLQACYALKQIKQNVKIKSTDDPIDVTFVK